MKEIIDFKYKDRGTDDFNNLRHSHGKSYEFILVHSGSGSFLVRDRVFPLAEGGIYFINGIETHCSIPDNTEEYCRSKLIVHSDLIDDLAEFAGCEDVISKLFKERGGAYITPDDEAVAHISSEFQKTENALNKPSSLTRSKILSSVISILICVAENFSVSENNERPNIDKRISDALEYINNNLSENLSLENISSKVHISRYYLCHTFKKQIGMSVFEYVLSRRLSKAKHYLAHTDIPISHIADKTGFSGFAYFSKIFRENEKITPSQFRLKNKQT